MDVRWSAVFIGFAVDYFSSALLQLLVGEAGFDSATQLPVWWMMLLLALMTGVGGFVAGRLAGHRRLIHGALVGAVGIIIGAFLSGIPRDLIVYSVLGWALGALGGAMSSISASR